jgi:alpha-mannosidase
VLAAADPGAAKRLAALAADGGTARLWVPAARSRAEAFGPDADLRGPRDLPVLIVAPSDPAGLTQAITQLCAELRDGNLIAPVELAPDAASGGTEAGQFKWPHDLLGEGAVALFNRGTPGCVVTPDGTLWMSLFRACGGWPSGVWIDGDRQTAPDGSSFAWQHWSHTFRYALASTRTGGGWREAGFSAAAEDYNHELVTEAADRPAGASDLPGAAFWIAGAPNITLSALKPVGNPLAAGRPGTPEAERRAVTVRLRETDGRAATAQLGMAGGIEAAWRTDLLEETEGAPLTVADGTASVALAAFETATVVVRPAASPGLTSAGAAAAPPEPVQPLYARYWLHGKGPAPAGNVPVAVHFTPTRITLNSDAPEGRTTLTVACGPEPASGTLDLVVGGELIAEVDGAPVGGAADGSSLRYDLPANGFASWDMALRAAEGTADGRYFVAARIGDQLGQVLEDTLLVTVGEAGPPDASLEPEELFFRMQSDVQALAGEAAIEVLTPTLRLTPGGSGELSVKVTSRLGSQLRGEVQLISPVGTWQTTAPWTQAVEVAPGGEATVSFGVTVPATAEPGWESWLLVKLMYFGRVRYSPAISLTVA